MEDDDVTILRPPPVYRGGNGGATAACGPGELAAVALDEWPAPDGGAFDRRTAARIRQRVLEHVALHAQPTYRFLGMLEAASGGRLRMRDLVHVERGALQVAARPGGGPRRGGGRGRPRRRAEEPAAVPGDGGYSLDAVLALVTNALELARGNQARIDEVHAQLRGDLQELQRALTDSIAARSSEALRILEKAYNDLEQQRDALQRQIQADEQVTDDVIAKLQAELDEKTNELQDVEQRLQLLQRVREKEMVPPSFQLGPEFDDLLGVGDGDEETDDETLDALIGGQLGARNRALREGVTVHLLLTPFTLGLLELARDEVSEMAGRGPRPLRLCALMHSFESGVASHFAKYAAQVWERQGAPPPLSADADGSTVVQPRKTRYNYAAEAALVTAARDYFSRLRVRADGSLAPAFHGRSLDLQALPDGVYAAHSELAASLPSYRRARIARTQLARDALGLADGTVYRRVRASPAYAPYAPVRRVAAERTVGGSTGRFAPLRFAPPRWG